METDLILTRLYATCLQPFGYYTVGVNGRYKDHDGNPIRVDYDYDLVKIEFLENFKDKYKPTIMLWNNGRVTVILHVVGYGDFCFPVTGKDEHHRERLNLYSWLQAFVEKGGNVEELLQICSWIERACINEMSLCKE